MSTTTRARRAITGLAAAGLLMAAGGILHPHADTNADYESALAGMFEASAWTASHAMVLLGFLLLALSMVALVRERGHDWPSGLRIAGWAVAIGAGLAVVESVPHLFASSEADALLSGEATPLTDLHGLLGAVTTPVVGLSIAALAVLSARDRVLGNGRIAAAVAVAGGLAYALSGPLMLITADPAFSPLFAGSAALAIWLVLAGVRTARRERGDLPAGHLDVAAAR
jgi:hypothetical protein